MNADLETATKLLTEAVESGSGLESLSPAETEAVLGEIRAMRLIRKQADIWDRKIAGQATWDKRRTLSFLSSIISLAMSGRLAEAEALAAMQEAPNDHP